MAEAKRSGWHVVSMKNDWRRVFAFEDLAMRDPRQPAAPVKAKR
jgi:hypothetical protein